jgi:hypothetical protein
MKYKLILCCWLKGNDVDNGWFLFNHQWVFPNPYMPALSCFHPKRIIIQVSRPLLQRLTRRLLIMRPCSTNTEYRTECARMHVLAHDPAVAPDLHFSCRT